VRRLGPQDTVLQLDDRIDDFPLNALRKLCDKIGIAAPATREQMILAIKRASQEAGKF